MPFDLFPPSHRSNWKKSSYSNIYILKTSLFFLGIFHIRTLCYSSIFSYILFTRRSTSYLPAQWHGKLSRIFTSAFSSSITPSITVQSRMHRVRSTLGYDPHTSHTLSPRPSKSPLSIGSGTSASLCTQKFCLPYVPFQQAPSSLQPLTDCSLPGREPKFASLTHD